MKSFNSILVVTAMAFSLPSFSQSSKEETKKDPEKEIIYKEKYDGYKYKVVPQVQPPLSAAVNKEDCKTQPKEPVPTKPKPRPKPKPKCNPCAPCPDCPKVEKVVKVEKEIVNVFKAHEISLLAGYGTDGMETSNKVEGQQVDKYYGLVVGARYTYRFDPTWNVSVEGLTNNTGMFGVGFSFGEKQVK